MTRVHPKDKLGTKPEFPLWVEVAVWLVLALTVAFVAFVIYQVAA